MAPFAQGQQLGSVESQVQTLHTFFPGQVRTVQSYSLYELPLTVGASRLSICVRVRLAEGFPLSSPPIISVSPSLSHRWVDGQMNVFGHPSLAGWNASCSLGKILKDIEIEFNLRSPAVVPPPSASNHHGTGSLFQQHAGSAATPSVLSSRRSSSHESVADFPEVEGLSLDRLRELWNDERAFDEFFQSTSVVRQANAIQADLMAENLALAKRNVETKQEIEDLKERLEELYTILELEEAELGQISARLAPSALGTVSIEDSLLTGLSSMLEEKEELSERLLEAFNSDKMDLPSFLTAYRGMRKAFHQHKIDMVKVKQHLQSFANSS